jgi:hypothetical protein
VVVTAVVVVVVMVVGMDVARKNSGLFKNTVTHSVCMEPLVVKKKNFPTILIEKLLVSVRNQATANI